MRLTAFGAVFVILWPALAAAQSWGGTAPNDPVPPGLLAPSDAQTTNQVGAAPGLINPTGALHGDADASRYDRAAPVAPVRTPGQDMPDAPPMPDRDGGPARL